MFCSFLETLFVCQESWVLEIISTHIHVCPPRNENNARAEHAPEQIDMPRSWMFGESESEREDELEPAVPIDIDNTLSDGTLVIQTKRDYHMKLKTYPNKDHLNKTLTCM